MVKLKIKDVSFSYGSVKALENVSLTLKDGEILSVIGPNGSGKTTLLRCINGLLKAETGVVMVDDIDIRRLSRIEIAKLMGMVPQLEDRRFPITVFDAILVGRRPYMGWKPSLKDLEIVSGILESLGLKELALRSLSELSGGEFRKTLIARALAQEPKVLLLDEPTNHLDLKHQVEVLNLLRKQVRSKGLCAVMAMHDLNLAIRYSDKILMLNHGKVYAAGTLDIITQENIKTVYGVEVELFRDRHGRILVSPAS